MANITLEGKEYKLDELTDLAKGRVASLQVTDAEINRLNGLIAITQTARNAYAQALAQQLPEKAHANKKKGVISINGNKYALEAFSQRAKAELGSLQATDQRLAQLRAELAIVQTAYNAYANGLKAELAG